MQSTHTVARTPELDGVRGVAIIAVLIFHYGGPLGVIVPVPFINKTFGYGAAGVDLFFVLSGFLITGILLESRHAPHYFRNFYARRALRILPAYIVVVGVFFWIFLPIAHAHHKFIKISSLEQVWYWLFMENWRIGLGYNDGAQLAHLWSVAVEEQFYLLWPVLVLWFSGKYFVRLTVALLIGFVLLRMGLAWHGVDNEFIRQATITRLDGLLVGAILAASPKACKHASTAAPFVLALGCALLLGPGHIWVPLAIFTNALFFGCLVARASQGKFKFLRLRVLRSFGKYSYAIYLVHSMLRELLTKLGGRSPRSSFGYALFFVSAGISVSYAIAWISWRVLEHPCLRLKRFFPHPDQVRPPEPVLG